MGKLWEVLEASKALLIRERKLLKEQVILTATCVVGHLVLTSWNNTLKLAKRDGSETLAIVHLKNEETKSDMRICYFYFNYLNFNSNS